VELSAAGALHRGMIAGLIREWSLAGDRRDGTRALIPVFLWMRRPE